MAAAMAPSTSCIAAVPARMQSTFLCSSQSQLRGRSSFLVSIQIARKSSRPFAIRASEEAKATPSKNAVFLSSVLGAAAAVTVGLSAGSTNIGAAFAASGPGTSGAQRTAEKADELLKSADALTTNESPPRFGPGQSDAPDATSTLAQKAGSGANEALQGTQQKLESGANAAKDALGQAQSGASDVARKASEEVDANRDGLLSSFRNTIQGLTGSAGSKVDEATSKAGSAVEDAKATLPGQH